MIRFLSLILIAVTLEAAPRLDFSTFFGGEFGEQANAVALDSDGNVYIVGQTRDVPASPGALSSVTGSSFDIFVLKVDPTGTQLLYLALFGGSARELGTGIAVDESGAAYVSGWTFSEDFPVTPGAAQAAFGGGTRDAFVAKISPDGSAFEYATYLGGGAFEDGNALVVDELGRAWTVGATGSADFPVTPDALRAGQVGDVRSAFVVGLSPDGSEVIYSSLLGGTGRDEASSLALDTGPSLWIAGDTASDDFPLTSGAFQSERAGFDDAFVVHIDVAGTPSIVAATLFGGADCSNPFAGALCDPAQSVAVDGDSVFLVGNTLSSDMPLAGDSVQPEWSNGVAFGDGFVARFSRDLSELKASTFLGGPSEDQVNGIVADRAGTLYVVGTTGSSSFPVTPNALQAVFNDIDEAFLVQLDPDLSEIDYSTFLGGSGGDRGYGIAVDRLRNRVVLTGETGSAEFPSTPGVIQPVPMLVRSEGGDAFIAQFEIDLVPRLSTAGIVNAASFAAGTIAPGEIISVFGRGVVEAETASLTLGPDGRVTSELAGVRLLINGTPAALTFVGFDQINAVVPYAAEFFPVATFIAERDGIPSQPVRQLVAPTAPALFTLDGSGTGQAAALNQDSTVNGLQGASTRDDVIILFGTGMGQTVPTGRDGAVAGVPLPEPTATITVRIGNVEAPVLYRGAAPGLVEGVIQINARIPATVIPGPRVPVSFTAGARRSQAGVTLSIK